MREKPETVDFPNAASQGAKIGSISHPSPNGNLASIGCVYSCTGAFSFALYAFSSCYGLEFKRRHKEDRLASLPVHHAATDAVMLLRVTPVTTFTRLDPNLESTI